VLAYVHLFRNIRPLFKKVAYSTSLQAYSTEKWHTLTLVGLRFLAQISRSFQWFSTHICLIRDLKLSSLRPGTMSINRYKLGCLQHEWRICSVLYIRVWIEIDPIIKERSEICPLNYVLILKIGPD
jgi:hypothetical protein